MTTFNVEVLDVSIETIEADLCEVHESGKTICFYRNCMKEVILVLVAVYPAHITIVRELP